MRFAVFSVRQTLEIVESQFVTTGDAPNGTIDLRSRAPHDRSEALPIDQKTVPGQQSSADQPRRRATPSHVRQIHIDGVGEVMAHRLGMNVLARAIARSMALAGHRRID